MSLSVWVVMGPHMYEETLHAALDAAAETHGKPDLVVTDGAPGASASAQRWALRRPVAVATLKHAEGSCSLVWAAMAAAMKPQVLILVRDMRVVGFLRRACANVMEVG